MVKTVTILSASGRQLINPGAITDGRLVLAIDTFLKQITTSFDLEIVFSEKITYFRNHDYNWADLSQDRVANSFSPKIIKLANGFYVQANSNHGIWEVDKQKNKTLLWRFNPTEAVPLATYSGSTNEKIISPVKASWDMLPEPALLFSEQGAVELSRSRIPFVATACFTDHCDFDTPENLRRQRQFFKKHQIRTTKGFFLNHFSKRPDNASWENETEELQQWQQDGHELCYHSLSQSLREMQQGLGEFFNFSPPFPAPTWIDHGYQPYNLSLYQKTGIGQEEFAQNLHSKNIQILWNYIDSGTATSGVLNQMNPEQFTLAAFAAGISGKSFQKKLSLLIKNALVHFYSDEKLIRHYAGLASSFKKATREKSLRSTAWFISGILRVSPVLLRLFFCWPWLKSKKYPLARYQPLFFTHAIAGKTVTLFQTIELLDFAKALDRKTIDGLIGEKGLFIGHTYFSVPLAYHDGRIFDASGAIQPQIETNFEYLGRQIASQQIWNPTLQELAGHWKSFNKVLFRIDEKGEITANNPDGVPLRKIS